MLPYGRCNFCSQRFSSATVGRHLESCKRREEALSTRRRASEKKRDVFHLAVKGYGMLSTYWMHLDVDSNSTLKGLDDFIRKTWVECCGHLSQFIIDGMNYVSMPNREFDDRGMNVRLGSVIGEGKRFNYEYDFGTTTALQLKVISRREGAMVGGKSIDVLARNDPPDIRCTKCGKKQATWVCSQCIYKKKAWFCDECSKGHKCGEEMLLPIVNSPRMGMCGYTG